jgi:hypothetical protein
VHGVPGKEGDSDGYWYPPGHWPDRKVSGLSLNAHDRQALARIEEALAGADPQLAAKLSSFSRLVDDGEMPERERIRQARRSVMSPADGGRRLRQPGAYRVVYWVAMAVAMCLTLAGVSFALASGHPNSKGACAGWQVGTCAKQAAPSGSKGQLSSLTP